MWTSSNVPLAWLSLTHNWRRLAASVAGIMCTVVLMFMQVGFLNALFDSQVALIRLLNADLVMLNRLKYTLVTNLPFPRRRVYQALAVNGVKAAHPLYVEYASSLWKNLPERRMHAIRVLAFNPAQTVFLSPEIATYRQALMQVDTALVDSKSDFIRNNYVMMEARYILSISILWVKRVIDALL